MLSSKAYTCASNQYGGIGTITMNENTDVTWLSQSGTNGGYLKDNVYLSMTVTLSSASYYPTIFEACTSNNNNGFMVTLTPTSGSWQAGSNTVLMNMNNLGTGIYKGTPTWTNMNRLEMYMNAKSVTTTNTITLSNVQLKYITSAPTRAPTRTPTESPTTRPPSPSPSHTPTESPTPAPTGSPTQYMYLQILSSKAYTASSNQYGGIGTITLDDTTNVTPLSQSGTNGGYLKDHVYLTMTVTLSSASYYPTTFEYCTSNNNNGFMVTLVSNTGSWQAGDNTVYMNLNALGTSIYKGTPTWTNMNRLEMYMNAKSVTTTNTITLSNVRLEEVTPNPTYAPTNFPTEHPTSNPTATPTEHPTPNPTASPTEHPTTRPPSPSPSHTPTESPTPSPTPTPTEHPTTLPPTLVPTTLPPTIAPTAILHNCHCTGCESHYKTNEHIEKSPTLCGEFCEQEGDKCQFSLFNSVTTKCYLYDQSQVSQIKIVPTGASKYTCYTKYHLAHGVAGAAQV